MPAPTDLDTRVAGICSEYESTIAALAHRSATLAAELASAQARIKVLEDAANAPPAEELSSRDT